MECEVPKCSNQVSDNPFSIRIGDETEYTDFTVCDECARLMDIIELRSRELEIDSESV